MEKVFITGVSTGIGWHTFKTLVEAGFHVIGTVRSIKDADRIRDTFRDKCTILVFDVQDQVKCEEEIKSIRHLLEENGLTCLINNAGIAVPGPLQYLTEEEFEKQMDINVKSVRRITNLLLPYLGTDHRYKAGKIINISSVSGLFNSPFNGAYCISKHALESMTDVYRRELSMFGISVSAIEPGPIKTEIWSKNIGSLDKFKATEYGDVLSSADQMIENAEASALDVSVISDLITKIIHAKHPKPRYIVHKNKTLFKILTNLIPDTWADRLVARSFRKTNNFRPI
jgi:NAD(P)-dependent dehydrogenase (short-subunit alcohol dehydrogenase family)